MWLLTIYDLPKHRFAKLLDSDQPSHGRRLPSQPLAKPPGGNTFLITIEIFTCFLIGSYFKTDGVLSEGRLVKDMGRTGVVAPYSGERVASPGICRLKSLSSRMHSDRSKSLQCHRSRSMLVMLISIYLPSSNPAGPKPPAINIACCARATDSRTGSKFNRE
jgi:hypothetical protein